VAWKIDIAEAGEYEIFLVYGCDLDDAGGTFAVSVGGSELRGTVQPTAGRTFFEPHLVGSMLLPEGITQLRVRVVESAGRDLMALNRVRIGMTRSRSSSDSGRYRFSLRRWPKESGLALSDPAPPLKGEYGDLMAGKALPITQARLRIGDVELRQRVSGDDQEVVFETELEPGPRQLQSWFLDQAGELLAGVYYLEVELLRSKVQGTDSSSLCPPTDSSCIGGQE
jgi:hypothetical protein